jgi:hypothetical protein
VLLKSRSDSTEMDFSWMEPLVAAVDCALDANDVRRGAIIEA